MLRKSWKLLVPELVCSAEDGRMRLHGIASSTVTDRHGDEITEKALRSMERQAVGQNIFLNHSWVMPEDLAGTVTAAQVQKASDGVWELHYDVDINAINQRAVDTWKAINNGTKLGISIEAMVPPNSTKRSAGGGIIIDDIELMGASFVAHPANTRAWTDYVVKSLTGYLPDKLRVMEATQGRDFYLKAAARANAEAMEDMSDDDAEPVAETESQVDAPEVIASDDPVVAAAVASDPPEVTDSADEPEVVFAAATVETAEVTPDVTDSTTTLKIDPDGTTTVWVENEDDADEASSKAASQDTSDTSPDTGSGRSEERRVWKHSKTRLCPFN